MADQKMADKPEMNLYGQNRSHSQGPFLPCTYMKPYQSTDEGMQLIVLLLTTAASV
jgi:hypothetical protein